MDTLLFWDKSNLTIIPETSTALAKYSFFYMSFIHTEAPELFATIEDESWRITDERKLLVRACTCQCV